MKRILAIFVLLVAALFVQPDIAEAQTPEGVFLTSINTQRQLRGLEPLTPNGELSDLAVKWSGVMAEQKALLHSDLVTGVTQNWKKLGENVGSGGSATSIATAFINSPSHLKNIIDPDFTNVGIGITVSENTIYVVQKFMSLNEDLTAKPIPVIPATTTLPPVAPPTTVVVEIPIRVEPAVPTTTTVPEAPKAVSEVNRGSLWKIIKNIINKWLAIFRN